ncbi:hypothetical protein B0I72DRAFT_130422 [Yarrowia lipolytica]|nr:hypothetical protein BKA91DRAFT_126150 [Yarrowia lipolytica]KAE8174855.1 hypothetical protein BKA90DRAFT_126306 [Yarrowia lipolytica]KAJ8052011.1 hypothetical protein LXG23DRAFT_38074 [Yarrowia lipolytica]RDW31061.1 hypothetical protein B0I72DRAFT_130422 [Yarrowia lipolytica]RDW43943.1 hypothetical protein B0I74DRAFT_130618 [Yarrowia lipolytica]
MFTLLEKEKTRAEEDRGTCSVVYVGLGWAVRHYFSQKREQEDRRTSLELDNLASITVTLLDVLVRFIGKYSGITEISLNCLFSKLVMSKLRLLSRDPGDGLVPALFKPSSPLISSEMSSHTVETGRNRSIRAAQRHHSPLQRIQRCNLSIPHVDDAAMGRRIPKTLLAVDKGRRVRRARSGFRSTALVAATVHLKGLSFCVLSGFIPDLNPLID